MSGTKQTDFDTFMEEIEAGIAKNILSKALSDVAMGVVTNHKTGNVTSTFKRKQSGESDQVNITTDIAMEEPTKRGSRVEKRQSDTVMYVGKGGAMTIFQPNQNQLFPKPTPEDYERS